MHSANEVAGAFFHREFLRKVPAGLNRRCLRTPGQNRGERRESRGDVRQLSKQRRKAWLGGDCKVNALWSACCVHEHEYVHRAAHTAMVLHRLALAYARATQSASWPGARSRVFWFMSPLDLKPLSTEKIGPHPLSTAPHIHTQRWSPIGARAEIDCQHQLAS